MSNPIFTSEFSEKIELENQTLSEGLQDVTNFNFPRKDEMIATGMIERWISKNFDVRVYKHADGSERLFINRRSVDEEQKTWKGDITWDELMEIKRQCGRGDKFALEIFPKDKNIVNVGNYRHLWIVDESKFPFVWANRKDSLCATDDWDKKIILEGGFPYS